MKRMLGVFLKAFDLLLLLTLLLVGLQYIGVQTPLDQYQGLAVLSDSMTPTFKAGDLLLTKEVTAPELKVGDIISYRCSDAVVTHRIESIEKNQDRSVFITKGDANQFIDEPVAADQIIGKTVKILPGAGKLGQIISSERGKILVVVTILNVWFLLYFCSLIFNKGEMDNEEMVQQQEW